MTFGEDTSLASVYAALSNDTRLRCLNLLLRNADVCVCEAVAALEISQPAASKAFSALKAAGMLDSRRDANWTYYSLRPVLPESLQGIVDATAAALAEQPLCDEDQQRMRALGLREKMAS